MEKVAILDKDKCRNGNPCPFICGRVCPVNRTGKQCIVGGGDDKPIISEELCIAYGICPKKCPYDVIMIIGLPRKGRCYWDDRPGRHR